MSFLSKMRLFTPARYFVVNESILVSLNRSFSKKVAETETDEPLSYLNSKAANWPARYSRTFGTDEKLWYEPLVVSGSIAIFLIYFCILREENDIDLELSKSLFERLPLEDQAALKKYKEQALEKGVEYTREIPKPK